MSVNYSQLRNWKFEDRIDSYSVRDSIIYSLSLGYGDDPLDLQDLKFIYEQETHTVPTILATIGSPGAWATNPTLGINWVQLLHGEHRMKFHAPVPTSASILSRTSVSRVIDKGPDKGALIVTTREISDSKTQKPLATIEHVSFLRADGGFGIGDEPLPSLPRTPDRMPDSTLFVRSGLNSAVLYRLNGDLNPIHILPDMALKAGFARPLLHGLCTYGLAARALIKNFCPAHPEYLRSISVRFTAPFFPGETLRIETWKTGRKIQFRALTHERNIVVLDQCIAEVSEEATERTEL